MINLGDYNLKIIFTETERSKELNRSRKDKESLWVVKKREFPWVKNSETTLCFRVEQISTLQIMRTKCLTGRERIYK